MAEAPPPVPGYDTAADMTGVTELRVHGVSGTPPSAMLHHPAPEQVTEGKLTAFYRRPRWSDRSAIPGERDIGRHHRRVEAYSWGGLTSGASSRALWLLLLPFALVNMAGWMHPPRPSRDGKPRFSPDGLHAAVWRLLALSFTATLVLTAVGMFPDLVGWQCSGRAECAEQRGVTRFLAEGSWWHEPSRAVAVTMLVPLAGVGLLWFLGRKTWQRYERRPATAGTTGPAVPLGHAEFWNGAHLVGVLRSSHIALAVALCAVFLTAPVIHVEQGPGLAATWILTAAALGVMALAAGLSVVAAPEGLLFADAARHQRNAGRALVVASGAVTAVALVVALLPHPEKAGSATATGESNLPGFTGTLFGLFTAQVALILVAGVVARRSRRPPQPTWRAPELAGLAGPVVALLALLLAVGTCAGAAVRFADWLGTPSAPSPEVASTTSASTAPGHVPLAITDQYMWAAFGLIIVAALALVVVVIDVLHLRTHLAQARPEVEHDFPAAAGDGDPGVLGERSARVKAVARARALAALTDDLGMWFVGPVAISIVVVSVVAIIGYLFSGIDLTSGWASPFQTAASWLLALFPLALVAAYRAAWGKSSSRHTIGILWDLTTFWPRAIHPLAPPCYGERTIPDLTQRLRLLTGDGAVILSTHSQGTVIGAAAVLQLEDPPRERMFLLTYGSPLGRLYARYWPAYFGGETLEQARRLLGGATAAEPASRQVPAQRRPGQGRPEDVEHCTVSPTDETTPRWRNLWRGTDPIGGKVFPDDDAWCVDTDPLLDPAALARRTAEVDPSPIRGHSDYPLDPEFFWVADQAAARLVTRLAPVARGRDRGPQVPSP